jgi:hypothetical protein
MERGKKLQKLRERRIQAVAPFKLGHWCQEGDLIDGFYHWLRP